MREKQINLLSPNANISSQQNSIFSDILFASNAGDKNNDKCSYIPVSDLSSHLNPGAFNLLSLNARSLPGCIDRLRDFIADSAADTFAAICIQEVWSAKKTLALPGYKPLFSQTRDQNGLANSNIGGGVGIFVKENIESEVLQELSHFTAGVYESIWLKVRPSKLKKDKSVIIASIYRPNTAPRASLAKAIEIHTSILETIKKDKYLRKCKLVILSDFNLDLLEFANNSHVANYLDTHFTHGLIPIISKSAHITRSAAKVIDHIFSNEMSENIKSGIVQLSLSDHMPTFYSDISISIQKTAKNDSYRLINETSTLSYLNLLKNIQFVTNQNEPRTSFDSFFELLTSSAELAFPLVKPSTTKSKLKNNPWTTKGIRISAAVRHKLFSAQQNKPSPITYLAFSNYNRVYNKLIKKAKKIYYKEAFQAVKGDLRKSWQIVNEITGRKKGSSSQLPNSFVSSEDPNIIIDSPQGIANGFNQFFNTIGPKLSAEIDNSHLPLNNHRKYMGKIPSRKFKFHPASQSQILQIVKNMKGKTSYGNDYVSNKLLKKSIPILLAPLTSLINISMATGFVPDQVKLAKVIPLFKEGSAKSFDNYRPIAIISTIGKLLEKVVQIKLTNYLEAECLLHPHQFGFRAFHNVTHPLLLFTDKILHSQNKNMFNITTFLDLKKAFCTVEFDILLDKLKYFGIENLELEFFKNYLKRSQFTLAGKTISEVLKMFLGLPQGTCIAPLLFLLYINDLPQASAFFTLLFADDTTLQLEADSIDQLFSTATTELVKIQEWFSSNKLTLNIKKTKFMIFFPENQAQTYPNLAMGSSLISRAGSGLEEQAIRFLGVWVDETLSFKHHIAKIKIKLSLAIYQLAQCKNNTPLSIKLGVYHSLFESHVRFGASVYGSASESDLHELFIQQKSAVRLLTSSHSKAHTDPIFYNLKILKLSDLLKLERIILVHKYKHGHLPRAFTNSFLPSINSIGRRGDPNDYSYPAKLDKNNIRLPTNLLISSWNQLPAHLKTIGELKLFKQAFMDLTFESYNVECSLPHCFTCKFS